jgi:hypothetical protein
MPLALTKRGTDVRAEAESLAAIAKSLTAVIIHPAPHPGAKFTPDQITPVWCQDED